MDKLDCQGIILRQYIKIRLQKTLEQKHYEEVVRLPLEAFLYAKNIFKKEGKIATLLLDALTQELYLKDVMKLNEEIQKRPDNMFLQVLSKMSGKKFVNLAQIMIRLTILALNVRLGITPNKIYRHKFKSLITGLQIQLIINGQEAISGIIIKELQVLTGEFNDLQFYEYLHDLFKNMNFDHITQWIEVKLAQKRKKFQEKVDQAVPFKAQQQSNQTHSFKLRKINKRVTIHGDIVANDQEQQVPNNTPAKINNSQHSTKRLPCILATKENGSTSLNRTSQLKKKKSNAGNNRFSGKFYFKSNKKNEIIEEMEYYHSSPVQQNKQIVNIEKTNPKSISKLNVYYSKQSPQSSDQNDNILCPATPPRTARKRQQ